MKAIFLSLLAIAVLAVVSLFVGVRSLSPLEVFSNPEAAQLILISRLPRTIAVLLTGASMAVAGLIMQMLVRNRFVEPVTAGTGQSAALGILIATMFIPSASIFVKMLIASVTAFFGSMGFLLIVRRLPVEQPLLVPLVGLVYGSVIGAGVTFVAYQADLLQYIEVWMNGEFSGILRGRYELLWLTGVLAVFAYFIADQFTIAGLGRDVSVNLGLNYRQVVFAGLAITSIITALNIVTVGMIPFVGLVVPNIASRLVGDNLRAALPFVAGCGGGLVLICDLLGRVLRHPYEIPVGTVFGVVGAIVFLWLLYAKPRHAR